MDNDRPKNQLLQYAGFAAQLAAALLIAVFIGRWIDAHDGIQFPIFIWSLPLIVLIGLMIKAVRDTSKK